MEGIWLTKRVGGQLRTNTGDLRLCVLSQIRQEDILDIEMVRRRGGGGDLKREENKERKRKDRERMKGKGEEKMRGSGKRRGE